MAIYDVNYDDKRFKAVENEKQSELNKYNETYDNLINERNNFTKEQQDMVDRWENTQKDVANKNLEYLWNIFKVCSFLGNKIFKVKLGVSNTNPPLEIVLILVSIGPLIAAHVVWIAPVSSFHEI